MWVKVPQNSVKKWARKNVQYKLCKFALVVCFNNLL